MTKKFFYLVMLMAMFMLSNVQTMAEPVDVPLYYVDPNDPNGGHHRTQIPQVSIEIYTLYFNTPCDGYVLRLLDEFDNVAYSTVIPVGATSLILPPYLFGIYELQLLPNNCNYYFYGTIDL